MKYLILIAVFAYTALVLGACSLQNRLIYHPDASPAGEPRDPRMRAVSFTAEDGNEIIAWYGKAQAGCPTFIHFHGNAGHIAGESWVHARVMNSGAGHLAVSWPGYAGSTGKPSEPAFHAAAKAAALWLETIEGVAPSNTILHGTSIGTGPATKLASEGNFGALILEAPFYSMLDLVSKKAPFLPVSFLLKSTFRSDEWIENVAAPILIVHGTVDRVIPQKQSRRLFERANEPKTYESFEGSDHNTLVRDGLYERAIWPFLIPLYPDCTFGVPIEDDQK